MTWRCDGVAKETGGSGARVRHTLARFFVSATVLCSVGVACLVHPTTVVAQQNTVESTSTFTYGDLQDAARKYSGGYASLDTTTGLYSTSPHGGYDSTSSKCNVCHAVHRAAGTYELLRAESQSDACEYCHLGGSAHSARVVYDANPGGTGTTVGHRIGASASIPMSTVGMSIVTTELASVDASGATTTQTVAIREAGPENKMFRFRLRHTQDAASSGRNGYLRLGPYSLSCMSCHQPHNAVDQVWKPRRFPSRDETLAAGYKLLRASPSGSIQGTDAMPYGGGGPPTVSYSSEGMRGYKAYTDFDTTGLVNAENVIRSVESTMTSETVGPGKTIWDTPSYGETASVSPTTPAEQRSPAGVDQYALSAWCADCHNLAVGRFGDAYQSLDASSHETTMTHASPMVGAYNGPGQCYTCHRGGLAPAPATASYESTSSAVACERCHYGTGSFAVDPARALTGLGDFPHSAEASGAYMLGAWTVVDGSVEPTTVTSANARQVVCMRCHPVSGRAHEPVVEDGSMAPLEPASLQTPAAPTPVPSETPAPGEEPTAPEAPPSEPESPTAPPLGPSSETTFLDPIGDWAAALLTPPS